MCFKSGYFVVVVLLRVGDLLFFGVVDGAVLNVFALGVGARWDLCPGCSVWVSFVVMGILWCLELVVAIRVSFRF